MKSPRKIYGGSIRKISDNSPDPISSGTSLLIFYYYLFYFCKVSSKKPGYGDFSIRKLASMYGKSEEKKRKGLKRWVINLAI